MQSNDLSARLNGYNGSKKSLLAMIRLYNNARRLNIAARCLCWAMVTLLGLLLIFLLLERTPFQSEQARCFAAVVLYWAVFWWLLKAFLAFVRRPKNEHLAVEIEKTSAKFNSGLSSSVEFINPKSAAASDNSSEVMRRLTVIEAAEKLNKQDINRALKNFSKRRSAFCMLLLGAITAIWYAFSPLEVVVGFKRLILPTRLIQPYSTLSLTIYPEHALKAVGQSVEIRVVLSRASKSPVILSLFEPDKAEGRQLEMYSDSTASESRFVYTLSSLQKSLDYQVSCEKTKSQRYSIKVMPRPEVEKLQLTLFQPHYISSEPIKPPVNTGDASVVINSRVKIDITANQNLSSASLLLNPKTAYSIKQTDKKNFSCEVQIATSTSFSIALCSEMGLKNEKPVIYTIKAIQDASPTIELLKPAKDIALPNSRRLDIKAAASDDFGVKAVILYYSVGRRKTLVPLNLKADFKPKKEVEIEYPFMLDTLALQPGVSIKYFIEAEDAKTPSPNTASTPSYLINMPSMYDLYRGEEAAHQNVIERLSEYIETQKMRKKALIEAYEQIRHEEKLNFEASEAIEQAIKEGEKSQKSAEEILQELKNVKQSIEDNPFSSPEALERIQKVSELLNEVLDDEAKEMLTQLQEALKEMKIDPSEVEKYENAFKMEDYLKGLDRNIELLTQLKEQQKINSLAEAINDLVVRQEHLASETAKLAEKQQKEPLSKSEEFELNDLINQQQKIGQELKSLQKQASELTKNKSSEENDLNSLLEDVKGIRDKLKGQNYAEQNQAIKNDMQNKNLTSAHQKQQNMLNFLRSLKKQAEQISMAFSGTSAPQLDLSNFIRRALNVSCEQEELFAEIEGFPARFMRGEQPEIEGVIDKTSVMQVLVKQQGQELENSLEDFVKSSFAIDPSVTDSIKGAQSIFSNIVKNLEDRALSDAKEEQQEIIRRFNTLAIDLMRAQDSQQQGSGSSSPKDALQQFKNLTRRQLSLYRQMLKKQAMPQSMQLMQDMKQMALEQKKIREGLEKLMRESRSQMNMLGRLNDVIKDMQDVETQILDPNLRRKAAEKQKQIYQKMLRAQKTIKERKEQNEERQAQKASEIIQQRPTKPLSNTKIDKKDLSHDYLSDTKEEYPSAYKGLINDYYKSLNIYGGAQ